MATLESRINQKTQAYSVQQISFDNEGDVNIGVDPFIQKLRTEGGPNLEEATKNTDVLLIAEHEQVLQVLRLGQNKDPAMLNCGHPAIAQIAAAVNTEEHTTPSPPSLPSPTWIQEMPRPRDPPAPTDVLWRSRVYQGLMQLVHPGTSRSKITPIQFRDEEHGSRGEDSQSQLAEATPVVEGDLPIATADRGRKHMSQRSHFPFYLMGGICFLLVVGAICSTGHCNQKVYVDASSIHTIAPTTTRDAVEAPKIDIVLTSILGKNYFQRVAGNGEGYDSDVADFLLETRQRAFNWIVNQDPMQLEYDSPNLAEVPLGSHLLSDY